MIYCGDVALLFDWPASETLAMIAVSVVTAIVTINVSFFMCSCRNSEVDRIGAARISHWSADWRRALLRWYLLYSHMIHVGNIG